MTQTARVREVAAMNGPTGEVSGRVRPLRRRLNPLNPAAVAIEE